MRRYILALVVVPALCLFVFAQTQISSPSPIDVKYRGSALEWSPLVLMEGCRLTVSGPDRVYIRQDYMSGSRPVFSAVDDEGLARPEGTYRWELVVDLPAGEPRAYAKKQVVSGAFAIRAGRIFPLPENEAAVVVDPEAPANALFLDREGRLGLGTTVPASQLHIKGTAPALTLEDTTTGGGAYTLRSLEPGDGSLGLFDQATGQARWLVDGEGRVGINTAEPTSTLTVDGYVEAKGFLVGGKPAKLAVSGGPVVSFYTEGGSNNFFGYGAGASNTTGSENSFFGGDAGVANTSGFANSFFGKEAGCANTEGVENSFFGAEAGHANTQGSDNSFFGCRAGYENTTGFGSSFFGMYAGGANTTGLNNSFFGSYSGVANTTGSDNSFFGAQVGWGNTTGLNNSFFGSYAGYGNNTGFGNSFFGAHAGENNTVEPHNTFIGAYADLDPGAAPATNPVTNATAIGYRAYVAQSNSLVLGSINGVNGGTSYVNVGIGTTTPGRQLHLAGPNAVFRMDRSADTASFLLVRTTAGGAPMKSFVVGTNASGSNQGEFIINDMGTAVGGAGVRRMTITNEGAVQFTGTVTAPDIIETSSLAFKTNVRTLENALEMVNRLRGVRFDWKESGKPAVGLIAEEVEGVVPEVVAHDGGAASGVSYTKLVAVLVEAVKAQQQTIEEQRRSFEEQREVTRAQRALLKEQSRAIARQQQDLLTLKADLEKLKNTPR